MLLFLRRHHLGNDHFMILPDEGMESGTEKNDTDGL